MPTINERILKAQIKHSVYLERYKTNVLYKILAILNDADGDLQEQIAGRLARIEERGFDLGPDTTARLEKMLEQIQTKREEVYSIIEAELAGELIDFSKYEADFQIQMTNKAGIETPLEMPSNAQLKSVVLSQPFQGQILKDWVEGMAAGDVDRIKKAIRLGITEGQTIDQIVRRVSGTKKLNYKDGIIETSRREAAAVVRTAVAHVQNRARTEVFNANADIVHSVQYLAVLDSRTTVLCASRDGNIYELGTEPPIPAHFNCRSIYIAYFGPPDSDAKRASIYGPVAKDVTFDEFLKDQSEAFQDEFLGPARAELWRQGKFTLDKFVDDSGKLYTLKDLKKLERVSR